MLSHFLRRYYGLICASRSFPPIYVLDDGSLPAGQLREGPHFIPCVYASVPPSVHRRIERALAVPSPLVQAFVEFVATQHPPFRALTGTCAIVFRGCKVRLMLRPAGLLALHRQGLLRSSFHLRSHLPEMSSMTTRALSQFPRPDLHRQHTQRCGLQTN